MNNHKMNTSLISNGYSTLKSKADRRSALKRVIKSNGIPDTILKLKSLQKQIPDPTLQTLYLEDISFLKKRYRKKLSKYTQLQQVGGEDETIVVEQIEYPEKIESEDIKVSSHTTLEKECKNDQCQILTTVNESHTVNGSEYTIYTLQDTDIASILELTRKYVSPNITLTEITEQFNQHLNQYIGIKVNGNFQGYFQVNLHENNDAEIIQFYVNKPYGSTLYQFLEKFFTENGFSRLYTVVNIGIEYAIRLLNFWYTCGFLTYGILTAEQRILMEKFL